jgi:acyl-CoA dehydrogenase
VRAVIIKRERIVAETAERIFAQLANPQSVASAKDEVWKDALWRTVEESCLTLAWVPDKHGGAGVSVAEGFEVISLAGAFALAIPLAETMLAGWLLSRAGIVSPSGAMTVAPFQPNDRITVDADGILRGSARAVAFAREAAHFAVLAAAHGGTLIVLVNAKDCTLFPGTNLAGDLQDDIFFDGVRPVASARASDGFDQGALMMMGCTVRGLQIAGALQSVLDRTVTYASERIAFGRPIAKFQAVQTNVARLAGEVAAARAAAESAADSLANATEWNDGVFLEAAAAKIRCAEAASAGAAIAHQVHGAIGLTTEHVLHRFTLRALAWSEDFGNDSYWAVALGNRVAMRGVDSLWPLIASR